MSSIPGLFDREQLKRLKNECGGLQTLLKVNGAIFHGEGDLLRTCMTASYIWCSLWRSCSASCSANDAL